MDNTVETHMDMIQGESMAEVNIEDLAHLDERMDKISGELLRILKRLDGMSGKEQTVSAPKVGYRVVREDGVFVFQRLELEKEDHEGHYSYKQCGRKNHFFCTGHHPETTKLGALLEFQKEEICSLLKRRPHPYTAEWLDRWAKVTVNQIQEATKAFHEDGEL